MKKNLNFIAKMAALLFFMTVLITGCTSLDNLGCPYVISNPRIVSGAFEDKHNFAGLHFSLFNDSGKDIESFSLSFMIYDSDGNNPFISSNCIVSKCEWKVGAGEIIDFVVDLDHYISVVPAEPYKVDYLYVREIRYADGSSWKDPFGMFCTKEEFE